MGVLKVFQEVDTSVMIVVGERKFQEDIDLPGKKYFDGTFKFNTDRKRNIWFACASRDKDEAECTKI